MTSVGSGALVGLALIMVFRLTPHRVVGTDVFHAALMLWAAGLAHLLVGNVDLVLMANILVGSLPGVWVGTALLPRVPAGALRPTLGCVLLGLRAGRGQQGRRRHPEVDDRRRPGAGRADRVRHRAPARAGPRGGHRMKLTLPKLTHLQALEAEAIHVMREVAAELERPVLLFSGGKDSIVLLRLAEKAFRPARFPFPLMHVDTGHNFPEVIEFRDRRVAELGERLIVARVQDSIDAGRVVEETGPRASRNRLQTTTLLDAIAEHGFDAAFGGARRDEERARAKERIMSFRDDFGGWDPKAQRPELWNLYNGRIRKGEHVRVFPLSNWTELDVWQYIEAEDLEVPSIYFAHEREVFRRDGMLYAVSDARPVHRRRAALHRERALPHGGRHVVHRRRRLDRARAGGRRGRDRGDHDHRARRDARRRQGLRGRDGGPQGCRLLLVRTSCAWPRRARSTTASRRSSGACCTTPRRSSPTSSTTCAGATASSTSRA